MAETKDISIHVDSVLFQQYVNLCENYGQDATEVEKDLSVKLDQAMRDAVESGLRVFY